LLTIPPLHWNAQKLTCTPNPLQVPLRRPRGAPNEIANLTAGDAVDDALAYHHADRRQLGPQADVPDAAGVGDHATRAGLMTTAANLLRLELGEVDSGLAVLQGFFERPLDVLVEMRLVLLHGQYELASPLHDPSGDVLLAAHGIDRHDGSLEIQKLEQLRNRRDFIGFRLGCHLAQGQVVLHRPSADHVQRRSTDAASSPGFTQGLRTTFS